MAAERSGPRISIDDRVMAWLACVTRTRIPVQAMVNRLADTLSTDAVLDEHPQLKRMTCGLVSVMRTRCSTWSVMPILGRENLTAYQRLNNSRGRVVDKDRRRGTMTWTTEGSDR